VSLLLRRRCDHGIEAATAWSFSALVCSLTSAVRGVVWLARFMGSGSVAPLRAASARTVCVGRGSATSGDHARAQLQLGCQRM